MGSISSWKMRVETGVPKGPSQYIDTAPAVGTHKSSVAGEGTRQRSTGLPDEEAYVEDDEGD